MATTRKSALTARYLAVPVLTAVVAAALPLAAAAQSIAFIEQVGENNNTAITQHGANNNAQVVLHGSGNGHGTVASQTRALVAYPRQSIFGVTLPILAPRSGPSGGTLTTQALESGVVDQDGQGHVARVNVFGDSNAFHVTQQGTADVAVQAVRGNGNQVGAVQSGALAVSNVAIQAQAGNNNVAVAVQQSGVSGAAVNNVSVQLQGGAGAAITGGLVRAGLVSVSALATTLGAANSAEVALTNMASGSNNVSLVEQSGPNNTALLVQAGSNNSIALSQPGNAFASVTQLGNGRSIGINQQAGIGGVTSPISITQF